MRFKKPALNSLPKIGFPKVGLARIGLLLAIMLLMVACGDHLIHGVSPVVRMNDLSHDGKNITLQLSLRNRNGVEMDVQHIVFNLSVEDEELFAYNGPAETNIAANGTETWTVEIAESELTAAKLNSLESGEVKSLPYAFSGKITTLEAGDLKFDHEGYLYPVPGRPGRFR